MNLTINYSTNPPEEAICDHCHRAAVCILQIEGDDQPVILCKLHRAIDWPVISDMEGV